MKVGIGMPTMKEGVSGELILEWARRADAGPFSSIAKGDRIAYATYELMTAMAALAMVTRRIRLLTSVLVLPTRNAGIVAKQAATIDALSGGRLTLGLGIGERQSDYDAAPAPFQSRARRFEEQLAFMKRVWAGQPLTPGAHPVGPAPLRPGGPELLIGAFRPQALRRIGRWADGLVTFSFRADAARIRQAYDVVEEAWRAEGRGGRPRFVAGFYFALGPQAEERLVPYLRDYYSFLGLEAAEKIARAVRTTSPQAIKAALQAFADVGTDEVILLPAIPELEQVDRLAQVVG